MSLKQPDSGIEGIEIEAERILKEARDRASEILQKANEEVTRISSPRLFLEEAGEMRRGIIEAAREEADREIAEAKVKASQIKAGNERKIKEIVSRMVKDITGV